MLYRLGEIACLDVFFNNHFTFVKKGRYIQSSGCHDIVKFVASHYLSRDLDIIFLNPKPEKRKKFMYNLKLTLNCHSDFFWYKHFIVK